jgi:hypothetical protein
VRVGADETVATGIGELRCARVEVARGDGSELLLGIGRDGVRPLARYETREQGAATRSRTLRALERTIY